MCSTHKVKNNEKTYIPFYTINEYKEYENLVLGKYLETATFL